MRGGARARTGRTAVGALLAPALRGAGRRQGGPGSRRRVRRYCLSGSSDSMIRLWDLGQQRCVHSYVVHTDSVWALASTPSFGHVYSGGSDQFVYLTDLSTRESVLLCTNEYPILQLSLQ